MSITAEDDRGALTATLDVEAFADLYARHRAALYRYCVAKTGDRQRAEDLVQEVFEKAFASRHRFDPSRPFWPWLTSIASRECIDAYRRHRYATSRLPALARETCTQPFDHTSTAVLRAMDERRWAQEIEDLPTRQRIALQLVALDQWTYADVADCLGTSVSVVKALIVRARRTLRETRAGSFGALGAGFRVARSRWQRVATQAQSLFPLAPASGRVAEAFSTAAGLQAVVALVAVLVLGVGSPMGQAASSAPAGLSGASSTALPQTFPDLDTPADPSRATPPEPVAIAWAGTAERVANEATRAVVPTADEGPESVRASTFAMSPRYEEDHTVFLAGDLSASRSGVGVGVPLLVSHDGGASWRSLRAVGLAPVVRMLFPPAYPDDPRLFAITAKGLQVSRNGGDTFETLAPLADITDAAVSPAFDDGQQSILLVAGLRLWEYRAETGVLEPVDTGPALAGHRVKNVAFSDRNRLLVGSQLSGLGDSGLHVSGCAPRRVLGNVGPLQLACEPTRLPNVPATNIPVRVPSSPSSSTVFIPLGVQPYVSVDGGRSFRPARPLMADADESYHLFDLDFIPSPTGQSAVMAQMSRRRGSLSWGAPLARTDDAGRTWTPLFVELPNFDIATKVAVTPTGRILAGSSAGGIACSEDGGRSWGRTCPTPEVGPPRR